MDMNLVNARCELKTLSNDLLTTGVIRAYADGCLEMINPVDKLPIIHTGSTVKISATGAGGVFCILAGKVFLSTKDFMRIVEVQNLADFERRSFFRLKVSISAKAYVLEDEVPADGVLKLFPAQIGDLSLSGCLMRTKKPLTIGQKLVINFNLMQGRTIALSAVVQRIIPPGFDSSYFQFGCEFEDVSARQSDLLCTYLFEKQREQIKSLREKQVEYDND